LPPALEPAEAEKHFRKKSCEVHSAAGAAAAKRSFAQTVDDAESHVVEASQGPLAALDGASLLRAAVPVLSAASPSLPAATSVRPLAGQTDDSAAAAEPSLTPFARQLKAANVCDDAATLSRFSIMGSKNGVHDMEDLFELSEDDVRASLEDLKMVPAQMRKLLKLLGSLDTHSPRKVARFG
jgi:hypothetical protein